MVDLDSLSLEELRKKDKEIKSGIDKEIKFDIPKRINIVRPRISIDKYTEIDDLLRALIHDQRDSIDQQQITNKLLLALLYKDGVGGSITPNGIDVSAILKEISGDDDYTTLVKHFESLGVSGDKLIFEIKGSGFISECKFQSSTTIIDNKTYGVRIMNDNKIAYQGTWAHFEGRNNYETDMTCWEDGLNNYYILTFRNIAYTDNLKIGIYESSASFTNIYIKYHKKV